MENLETMKRLRVTAAGLGDCSGLLEGVWGLAIGSGEEVRWGSIRRLSFHSPARAKTHFTISVKSRMQSQPIQVCKKPD